MKRLIFLISALLLLQLVSARFVEEELEEEERKDLEEKKNPKRWLKVASKVYNKAKPYAQKAWRAVKDSAIAGAGAELYDKARERVRTWGRKRNLPDVDELDDIELQDYIRSQLQ